MQIKGLDEVMVGIDGKALQDGGTPLTRREVLIKALTLPGPSNPQGEVKYARWHLALRLRDAGDEVEVKVEEVATMKQAAGEVFAVGVMGPVWDLLEGGNS